MKKNIFLTTIISLMILTFASAQGNMQDVLYLKNGTQIRGKIISKENGIIRIEYDGSISRIYESDILREAKEEMVLKKMVQLILPYYKEKTFKTNPANLEAYLKKKAHSESGGLLNPIKFEMIDEIVESSGYTIGFKIFLQATDNAYSPVSWAGAFKGRRSFSVSPIRQNTTDKEYKKASFMQLSGIANLDTKGNIVSVEVGQENTRISKTEIEYVSQVQQRVNDAVKYVNQFSSAVYLKAEDLPVIGTVYLAVNLPESKIFNPEAAILIQEYLISFAGSPRFVNITKEEWQSATDAVKYNFEFVENVARLKLETGIGLATGQPYSGYEMDAHATLSLKNANGTFSIFEQDLSFQGGRANTSESGDETLDDIERKSRQVFNELIYNYYPVQANIIGVTDSTKKGVPKEVALDKAEYFNVGRKRGGIFSPNPNVPKLSFYFIVSDPRDIYQTGGTISTYNKLATLEFKKMEDGKALCKVLSGEMNIKSYLDAGKELGALSIIYKPEAVKK